MKTYLVTGCAGFIGSNFVHYMLEKYEDIRLVNLDKLTYAGNLENLQDIEDDARHIFVQGDICDKALVTDLIAKYDPDTTNSCVAVMEGGEPVVIANSEGARTTPSVVGFTKTGDRLVGQVAKRQAITNPDNTVSSIKRQMGTDHKVTLNGKEYTPQQVSAMILQKLKADAEAYLGETVTEAVITVPKRPSTILISITPPLISCCGRNAVATA